MDRNLQGGEAVFVQGNVASASNMRRLSESALGSFSRLDILVNNAAVVTSNKIEDMPEEDWNRTTAVVLKAVYWTTKYPISAFREMGRVQFVHLSLMPFSF